VRTLVLAQVPARQTIKQSGVGFQVSVWKTADA